MKDQNRLSIRCISIKQPWASAIIRGYKGIENRTWSTRHRGQLLIHASKNVDRQGYAKVVQLVGEEVLARDQFLLESLPTGGIIGWVDLIDVVKLHHSPWFIGPYGWVLADPHPIPFVVCHGKQTLFRVPVSIDLDIPTTPRAPAAQSLSLFDQEENES